MVNGVSSTRMTRVEISEVIRLKLKRYPITKIATAKATVRA